MLRKWLLSLVVLVGVMLLPAPALADRTPVSEQRATDLTFDRAIALALHYDALWDSIPEAHQQAKIITTDEDLVMWTAEIVPYFAYEGIADPNLPAGIGPEAQPGAMVYPTSVGFENYGDGALHHFHVLGQTECFGVTVTLNGRTANPVSPWYGRTDALGTLVHELAHAQGICFGGRLYDAEVSAQIVTLEVLAAMANRGTEPAIVALVGELRDMSIAAAKWAAVNEGRRSDYEAAMDRIYDSAYERAGADKAARFWATKGEMIIEVLYSYNYMPISAIETAFAADDRIFGAQIPVNWWIDYARLSRDGSYAGPAYDLVSPTPFERLKTSLWFFMNIELKAKPLMVDDLHYFVTHAEEMIAELDA